MTIDVMVNGRSWRVDIEPDSRSGALTVTVNGRSRDVDASWVDADTLSLIDGGASHEIRLHRRDDGASVGVEIAGEIHEAAVSTVRARPNPRPAAGGGAAAGDTTPGRGFSLAIKAPMPGRVVRVLVATGDRVKARQAVVVVEAMKMENELRSPRDGIVTAISAAPGAAVETGAVLVVIGD